MHKHCLQKPQADVLTLGPGHPSEALPSVVVVFQQTARLCIPQTITGSLLHTGSTSGIKPGNSTARASPPHQHACRPGLVTTFTSHSLLVLLLTCYGQQQTAVHLLSSAQQLVGSRKALIWQAQGPRRLSRLTRHARLPPPDRPGAETLGLLRLGLFRLLGLRLGLRGRTLLAERLGPHCTLGGPPRWFPPRPRFWRAPRR